MFKVINRLEEITSRSQTKTEENTSTRKTENKGITGTLKCNKNKHQHT